MTKQLYEEALADVKKLKEVAEDNAKRALLEAVTPRIRDLIENQLLGEVEADEDKLLHDEELDPFSVGDTVAVSPVAAVGDSAAAGDAISLPDDEGKVTLDLDALKVPGTDEFELSKESVEALGMLLGGEKSERFFENRIQKVKRQIGLMRGTGRLVRESKGYSETLSSIISEVEDMYSHLQTNLAGSARKARYEAILESFYSTLKQLTERKMTKKNARLSEADVTLKLTGLPDDVDLDSVGVDLITGGDEGEGEEESSDDEDLDLGGEDEEEGGDEGDEEGEEGDGEEEDLDLGLEDEGGDEDSEEKKEGQMEARRLSDNLVVEIDEGMLRREIARMKALREAKDDVQAWGHGAGDVSDEFEDDDMGDPFLDVSLREQQDDEDMDESQDEDMDEQEVDQVVEIVMDEEDVDEEDMDEAQMDQAEDTEEYGGVHDEAQTNKQSRQPGATVEGLRRRLASEARIQLEAKKKAQGAKKQAQQKQKEAQQKHKQAKQKMKEAQDQEKQGKKVQAQQNKKVAQQKQKEAQQKAKQAKQMKEAYVHYATRFNESVARSRRLRGMLTEAARNGRTLNGAPARSAAETSSLRNKLAETNLFNAKLLFTNKLLQNEALTKRQKAEVIERLDEAKSEREVKLVYESLVKTLQGTTSKLTESVDRGVIGSSSRPARPASTNTLNEGFESDRWARLAGIVK